MGQYWGMRIVSLLPSATEIVCALGLEGHLVGVTDECDWPPQARMVQVVSRSALPPAAEPAEIDRLVSASIGSGQPLYRLDTDAISDLRPDLVLAQDLCAVCAVPSGHVTQALDALGCQAEVISLDPSSLDEVLDGVLQVGKAAGVPERAGEVVAGLRKRLANVHAAVEGLERPRVFALEWGDPPFNCPAATASKRPSRRRAGPCWRGPSWPGSRRLWRWMPAPTARVRVPAWSTVSRSSPRRSTRDGCRRHRQAPPCGSSAESHGGALANLALSSGQDPLRAGEPPSHSARCPLLRLSQRSFRRPAR
jgi:Periplasmic binding protein